MRLFLCGYGEAGRSVLRYLHERDDIDLAVFTHPDHEYAQGLLGEARARGLFATTDSVNSGNAWPFVPDIIASVYYLTIINRHVIKQVEGRIFNAHTSLLPRHRGRSSVPWAIIHGDKMTGLTYHYIDDGIDTGPILFQVAIQIDEAETQASLFKKMDRAVIRYFPTALHLVKTGMPGQPQTGDTVYHSGGCPYGGVINPYWPPGKIERFIRAMIYPPYPYATYEGQEIRTIADYRRALLERQRHNLNALPQL